MNEPEILIKYISELDPAPSSSEFDRNTLHYYLENRDNKSFQKLILLNQYIVFEEVLSYCHYGLSILDLIQFGNLAIAKAIINYNKKFGNFKNYLHRRIFRNLENHILQNCSIIRFPHNIFNKILHYYHSLLDLCIDYDVNIITNYDFKLEPSATYDKYINFYRKLLYLRVDDISELNNTLAYYNRSDNISIKDSLIAELNDLDERTCRIIKLYYGIDKRKGTTLKLIGQEYQFTRERARQLLKKGLAIINTRQTEKKLLGKVSLLDLIEPSSELVNNLHLISLRNFVSSTPVGSMSNTDKESIAILENYVLPRRRKYPGGIKNQAKFTRKLVKKILDQRKQPMTQAEIYRLINEDYSFIQMGTVEYAISTMDNIRKDQFGHVFLIEWYL